MRYLYAQASLRMLSDSSAYPELEQELTHDNESNAHKRMCPGQTVRVRQLSAQKLFDTRDDRGPGQRS